MKKKNGSRSPVSCLPYFSALEMAATLVFSLYCLDKDNTTLDRKTTDMTKRRQHTTNTRKMHSVQLVLVGLCLGGSLSSSSSCLYRSSAALSRAICSARSLNFTVSNCQGPALLGDIGIGRGAVGSRHDRG